MSIFDKDLAKKDILYGDLLEVEGWECSDMIDYEYLDRCIYSSFSQYALKEVVNKPSWKKFLVPFKTELDKSSDKMINSYIGEPILAAFTTVVLCCSTMEQIHKKLKEFITDLIDANPDISPSEYDESWRVKKFDVGVMDGLYEMAGFPCFIFIRFQTSKQNISTYLKLKFKDS